MNTMDIKDIIKDLNHICEDVDELHKLFNLNKYIKPHISRKLYINYNKELENIFFESFINTEIDIKKDMNEIIYLISEIIVILNKIILNYP